MGYRHWAGIGVKEVCQELVLHSRLDRQDCMTALDYYEGAAEKGESARCIPAYPSVRPLPIRSTGRSNPPPHYCSSVRSCWRDIWTARILGIDRSKCASTCRPGNLSFGTRRNGSRGVGVLPVPLGSRVARLHCPTWSGILPRIGLSHHGWVRTRTGHLSRSGGCRRDPAELLESKRVLHPSGADNVAERCGFEGTRRAKEEAKQGSGGRAS